MSSIAIALYRVVTSTTLRSRSGPAGSHSSAQLSSASSWRSCVLSPGCDEVARTIDNAASAGLPLGDGFELEKHLESIQKAYLHKAMDEAKGKLVDAAKLLGISKYQTLSAQLKRLDVDGDWSK